FYLMDEVRLRFRVNLDVVRTGIEPVFYP
ncbi:MAG: hypothetical protein RLZZ207_1841, partial [Bacteroidota bacterium]